MDKKAGTFQKRYSTSKDKKKPDKMVRESHLWYNKFNIQTHKLENNYITEFLPPQVRFLSLGSSTGKTSPQSIWPWRPVGLDCRSPTRLGEIETSLLKGAHKISHARRPRAKAVYLIGTWTRPTCWSWRVSWTGWGRGKTMAHPGDINTRQSAAGTLLVAL